jgi:N-methylhydantoinase B
MLIGHGVEVPNSAGLFGGLEGSCNETMLLRASESGATALIAGGQDPESLKALGAEDLGPKPGHFELHAGDVLAYTFQGGGGYGDPLDREPRAVTEDVAAGYVTLQSAERYYGVVVRDGQADAQATRAARLAIRTRRLGGREPVAEARPVQPGAGEVAIGPSQKRDATGQIRCGCGYAFGPPDVNWKDAALTRIVEPSEHGPAIRLHPELELREHVCPSCGTLLESEVARKASPSLHTIELR